MSLVSYIKSSPALKRRVHWMIVIPNEARPRWWTRLLVNPFIHKKGKHAVIRRRTRIDVFPFNKFALGSNSVIEDFATINNGVGDVTIGNNTIVGISNVIIGPVSIGNEVMLAQNIVISGLNHAYEDVTMSPSRQKEVCKQVIISDEVWIGSNAVITAGVTLGRHCVIGAGSVVTKDVPEFSVAVGNPAKVIKKYDPLSGKWEKVSG
jgi:acetyltransferase-like isoleucine patch superfamily enzyme